MTAVCLAPSQGPAPAHAQPVRTVRIAAASDLQYTLPEILERLSLEHPSIRVQATYGSSGNFHAQLRQRAPFDLYLSADIAYPRDLVTRGTGSRSDLFEYAVGRLVVWLPPGSPLPVEREGLAALTAARRLAIANPRHAPYGRAAEAALRRAGIWERMQPRLLLGENIAQTAQFVQSGGADAGIIALSLVLAPAMRGAGTWWEVPEDTHPPLVQGGLVLPWAASREATVVVRDYLLGDEGRAILSAYGFGLPD